jgi:hypothetical protein
MRTIVNYFRQVFCKHDFLVEESHVINHDQDGYITRQGTKVYMRCTKCGYHTNHWKF